MLTPRLGNLLLNHTYQKLQNSTQVVEGMDDLFLGLKELHDFLPRSRMETFYLKTMP